MLHVRSVSQFILTLYRSLSHYQQLIPILTCSPATSRHAIYKTFKRLMMLPLNMYWPKWFLLSISPSKEVNICEERGFQFISSEDTWMSGPITRLHSVSKVNPLVTKNITLQFYTMETEQPKPIMFWVGHCMELPWASVFVFTWGRGYQCDSLTDWILGCTYAYIFLHNKAQVFRLICRNANYFVYRCRIW